jgi:glycine/D-amino acid oxidase-like deaminating enzyme
MIVDYLVVGQGICGTLLSWNLLKEGKTVLVIDEPNPYSSSKAASGVINPVTGRRIVRTWMIEELFPFAQKIYDELENELQVKIARQCNVIDFHPTLQMKEAFEKRLAEGEAYLQTHDENKWRPFFNFIYGAGEVDPCLLVNLHALLYSWRARLAETGSLSEEKFDITRLHVQPSQARYKDITAEKIIFCDGISSCNNPYFNLLPFAPNKGEALIVQVPGLPATNIFKQGISIVPWKDDLFWVGSSYQWTFENDQPTQSFRIKTAQALRFWLNLPFTIVEHMAAVRPATIERRPFIGLHPQHPAIGIFNGMGTKGCSLAPFFAHQLTQHLVHQTAIAPEADVQRFRRILSQDQR